MCKPNNHHPHQQHRGESAAAGQQRRYPLPLPAVLAALLWQLLPAVASASLETTADASPAVVQARLLSATKTAGGYRVRCWQHGRLLFEENNVTLPADGSRYALKLSGSDGNGRPLYVAETQNATCLVRHAPSAVANPGLPR